jgi:hypothetical protein
MVSDKSLDDSYSIIAALLGDVHDVHSEVFNTSSLRSTCLQVKKRLVSEGMGFLTKTLPRLGKAFDKALAGNTNLNSTKCAFASINGTELPRFLGEFFKLVLRPNGTLLESPCATSVKVIRQVCYLFYKYELPYTDEQEQQVIQKFEKTEEDLTTIQAVLQRMEDGLVNCSSRRRMLSHNEIHTPLNIAREARILLNGLFSSFDPKDIHPKHGPGAVATKQQLHEKYLWSNVSVKITNVYPFDAYFCASFGHVCDSYDRFSSITDSVLPAKVILVPKDSRGPRLISCEPVDYQWVQQGLGGAIVDLVESHPLTRDNVRFTDQSPNRFGALAGSKSGKYATLDLNEASDRVSTALVRLLFPHHVYTYLEACRTSSTRLPDGRELELKKFAPMGSCLCFPILALTIWALLTAATNDADTRESIYVYGDDVIVPTTYVANAIRILESFGLKINQDKSCTAGLFRESCGMDAFNGVDVTPVRLRTVWSSSPSPEVYTSWIAYANSFWDRRYYRVYNLIVERMHRLYGAIPSDDMHLACPSLRDVSEVQRPKRRRINKHLQKCEYYVWDVQSPVVKRSMDGWSMLLRYFAEATDDSPFPTDTERNYKPDGPLEGHPAFSVSQYTSRRASMLVRRWR